MHLFGHSTRNARNTSTANAKPTIYMYMILLLVLLLVKSTESMVIPTAAAAVTKNCGQIFVCTNKW